MQWENAVGAFLQIAVAFAAPKVITRFAERNEGTASKLDLAMLGEPRNTFFCGTLRPAVGQHMP